MTTLFKHFTGIGILAAVLFLFGCAQKQADAAKGSAQNEQPAAEEIGGSALVTFIELGSQTCIPCRMMQPVMKAIETEYAGRVKVIFYDVGTEEEMPRIRQYGIRAIPTQVFLDENRKEFFRHTGFYPKDSIVALLKAKGIN
jgi:thioredoxin 1